MNESALLSPQQQRRNFILGIGNGTLVRLYVALTDPSLILTWFVSQLGASPLVIGLLLPITNGGWFLPQLLTSSFVQRQPRKMPIYWVAALLRTGCWASLTAAVFLIGNRNAPLLLALFMLLYTAFSLGAGLAGLSFMDIVAKAIPADRRGTFFAWREFTGGLLALGGSALARYALDERRSFAFPLNFGWLFIVAGMAAAVAYFLFAQITEPLEPINEGQLRNGLSIRVILSLLRQDRNYAVFVLARVMLLVSTVAVPFYSVFAKERLGAPMSMAGTYLGAFTAALVSSTLLWGWLSEQRSNRTVLWWASLLSIPLPLAPLLLGQHISYTAFIAMFVLLGITQTGIEIGSMSLTLDIAPATERALYVGLINTVLGVVSFALTAGGWVVQRWGLNALFLVSAGCIVCAVVLVGRLRDA